MAKTKHLGVDRSCVLAAFYRRLYEQGTSELEIVNGNYGSAVRDLGLDGMPAHRFRTAVENLSLSENGRHRRLTRDPRDWAKEKYFLKEEAFHAVRV